MEGATGSASALGGLTSLVVVNENGGMAHRKTVRHFRAIGHPHELTFSCYRRMLLLSNDAWRERLARCLDVAGQESAGQLVGFAFMPEHVHRLVNPRASSPTLASLEGHPIGRRPAEAEVRRGMVTMEPFQIVPQSRVPAFPAIPGRIPRFVRSGGIAVGVDSGLAG